MNLYLHIFHEVSGDEADLMFQLHPHSGLLYIYMEVMSSGSGPLWLRRAAYIDFADFVSRPESQNLFFRGSEPKKRLRVFVLQNSEHNLQRGVQSHLQSAQQKNTRFLFLCITDETTRRVLEGETHNKHTTCDI